MCCVDQLKSQDKAAIVATSKALGSPVSEFPPGLFFGSGVGLQDLAVASAAAQLAEEQGKALSIKL